MNALRLPLASLSIALAATSIPGANAQTPGRGALPALETSDSNALGPPVGARSVDGRDNNPRDRSIGSAGTRLRRLAPAAYADGVSALAGTGRPGPREVSNAVSARPAPIPNEDGASAYLWQWGQFVDHDLDLVGSAVPPEPAPIAVPAGDPSFDPLGTGTVTIRFNRSAFDPATGTVSSRPREQVNSITGWIDASMVYGSDDSRARSLRSLDGTGRLRTSPGDLLPMDSRGQFLAGDTRVNEQIGLISIHTLFLREHNRLADLVRAERPLASDEEIYQRARRLLGAEVAIVTYEEFLPILLGPSALPRYRHYDPKLDAGITNEFATAGYRFGHSTLNPILLRLDEHGQEIPAGHVPLARAFGMPGRILNEGGIDPVLRGLAAQAAEEIDPYVVDDVRNSLFGPPGSGGLDLVSLNIQRGRDHGLPSYSAMRKALGLPRVQRFDQISSDPEIRARLASVYGSVDDVDLWVGGLAEDHVPGALLGPVFHEIVRRQFLALRDADRYWYERSLTPAERSVVDGVRLADIVRRNTGIRSEFPDQAFLVR